MPGVGLSDFDPRRTQLDQIRLLLPYFDVPTYELRKFYALVVTNQGIYEDREVVLVERDKGLDHGGIDLRFKPLEAAKPMKILQLVIYTGRGEVAALTRPNLDLLAGDLFHPSYKARY